MQSQRWRCFWLLRGLENVLVGVLSGEPQSNSMNDLAAVAGCLRFTSCEMQKLSVILSDWFTRAASSSSTVAATKRLHEPPWRTR